MSATVTTHGSRSPRRAPNPAPRRLPFDRRVETLIADRAELAPIVRPMLAAWRQLRQHTAAFDKAVRVLVEVEPHLPSPDGRARDRRSSDIMPTISRVR